MRAALLEKGWVENPLENFENLQHAGDYRVHALCERVKEGLVRLVDCPTFDMVADPLTKNLPAPDFERHRSVMLGTTRHNAPLIPVDLTIGGPNFFPPSEKRSADTANLPHRPFVANPYTTHLPSGASMMYRKM